MNLECLTMHDACSIRFDKRNKDGLPHYTYLIVDAMEEYPKK